MYIASLDVGIKNLAICVLSISTSKTTTRQHQEHEHEHEHEHESIDIHHWQVIDLMDSPCCEVCKKNATVTTPTTIQPPRYFCKTHAKSVKLYDDAGNQIQMYTKTLPDSTTLQSMKKNELGALYSALSACSFGSFGSSSSKTSKTSKTSNTPKTMKKQELIAEIETRLPPRFVPYRRPLTKECSWSVLGKRIVDTLTPIMNTYSIQTVLIENQISPIAMRMKTLQGMLTQYFIMKGVDDIHAVSSSNKLKVAKWIPHEELSDISDMSDASSTSSTLSTCSTSSTLNTPKKLTNSKNSKNTKTSTTPITTPTTYAQRKQSGITLATTLFAHPYIQVPCSPPSSSPSTPPSSIQPTSYHQQNTSYITYTITYSYTWSEFHAHKKKDDLADAFLQGLWWIGEHHPHSLIPPSSKNQNKHKHKKYV